MKIQYECKYCGNLWEPTYTYSLVKSCPKCDDKDIKKRIVESKDVFGYNYDPKAKKQSSSD